jgi:hypothetical protein
MRIYTALVVTVLTMAAAVAQTGPMKRITWSELAADPGRYMGQQLEIAAAYCTQGGASGTGPGYQCSTDGDVYIATLALLPASAKEKVDANCGGMDFIERSSFCRARIRFTPSSFGKSNDIDPPKSVLLVNTAEVYLTF